MEDARFGVSPVAAQQISLVWCGRLMWTVCTYAVSCCAATSFYLPFMCRHCPGASRPLRNGARHSCNGELPFMGNGCRPDHCSTLSDHSLSAIIALLGKPLFVAIVSGVVGRCSRRGSEGQGHTPAESLLGGCFWAVSPQTPQTVQVRRLFGPQTAPQTDPRQTPDSTRDGHPAGALPYSGTSACAPPGRCVSRCRSFGAARGDCAGPGREAAGRL